MGNMKLGRKDLFMADPFDNISIVTPSQRDDAGPLDSVDASHPLCEENERPIDEGEILFTEDNGIIEPIRAQRNGDEQVIVVVGRRRTRMARLVNLRRQQWNRENPGDKKPMLLVPVMLVQGDAMKLRGIMLAENLQRKDYNAVQIAKSLSRFMEMGATLKQAAEAAGKEEFYVKSHVAVLDLSAKLQKAVADGQLSVTAAFKLADLPRDQQEAAFEALPAGERMTAQAAKRAVATAKKGESAVHVPSRGELAHMQALLSADFGELTPTERKTAIAILEWVRTGKRPKEFALPRLTQKVPVEEKV